MRRSFFKKGKPVDCLRTIFERRAVREYTGQPVDREILLTLVRAGMAAPTSKDRRHLRFVVVDDGALVDQMVEDLPYSKMLATARHAIIVASDLSVAYAVEDTDYWAQNCAAAAQNILLAATAQGLGSCWTSMHPREERIVFLRKILKLPEYVRPFCVIAIGFAAERLEPRDKFNESHVFWR
ncbi:MAG TPA: nitroreductase family protein [Candidatus Omnitrophota bacterium]|jgi:nitroreductase|nr:nitroreductase family protein [Candidatus Omnitrophota bacterium]